MPKISIMQPYLFPYIGYFQLISAVDEFVFYDDVNFIKQGWVHRNVLKIGNQFHYFSVPIHHISSFTPIHKTEVHEEKYHSWKRKFRMTLKQNYSKSPHLNAVLELVEGVLDHDSLHIGEIAARSIVLCSEFLGIKTSFKYSSIDFPKKDTSGSERVVEICEQCQASCYINLPGGKKLYSQKDFAAKNMELKFLAPQIKAFQEGETPVSILDMLLCYGKETVRSLLPRYHLE